MKEDSANNILGRRIFSYIFILEISNLNEEFFCLVAKD